jgi:16S rRNA (adenine1518-N6/adenine1519-N6)-dimethyltransferase
MEKLKSTPPNILTILKSHGVSLKKSLGQNFLIDPFILDRIVASAEIPAGARVLEIGSGAGSLTWHLAAAVAGNGGGRVVAVELDEGMVAISREVLEGLGNVSIIHGDILKLDPAQLMDAPGYLVVANIPYYITSALIRHLLESQMKPSRLVLTLQNEVAERICAAPGDLSLLALSVQVYGSPRLVMRIPASAFYPPPKVDSAVLRIDVYADAQMPADLLNDFFSLSKAGFSQKRKTLRNSLAAGLHIPLEKSAALLTQADIDPMRRAQTLSLDEWRKITTVYRNYFKMNPG